MCKNPVGEGANRVTIWPLLVRFTLGVSCYKISVQKNLDIDGVNEANGPIHAAYNRRGLSTPIARLQTFAALAKHAAVRPVELLLEEERDQLPLWVPVAIGTGIAAWFILADARLWAGFIILCGGFWIIARTLGQGERLGRTIMWFTFLAALGCALIWFRSWNVSAPVLERPTVAIFHARIEKVEPVSSRDLVRLTLATEEKQDLPPRVRVNVPMEKASEDLRVGAVIKLRARLMPPAMAALPGAYDFSQRAWFSGLGATGQALGDIEIVGAAQPFLAVPQFRAELSEHVRTRMSGGAGAIGATLATGDRGAISEADAEAMRRSGLAHLLSISGLHVTAVVGAVYLLVLKLLALSPFLALRFRLPLVAAGFAAAAALGYTLLTGAQVPTIRACVAALLVLTALMLGRSAITLRMVAAGALFVLIIWPESLVGPSFQLSFAAVTAIIALHEHPRMKAFFIRRDEGSFRRIARFIFSLFLTGLAVEIALMPIALFHFHKAGVYGAFANIIAIPLTTFLIMPLEALALLLDTIGLGAPVWWLCEKMLGFLIALAHYVSTRPGAITMLPTMPRAAFALVVYGGLWLCLWRQNWRYAGLVPALIGAAWMMNTRAPDLYITGDGRHVGIRSDDGKLAMLRASGGDFIRSILRENAGVDGEAMAIEDWPGVQCNRDSCVLAIEANERKWTLLATRSSDYIPAIALAAACRKADIVVSERRLPASCQPRWIKADRYLLGQTGGMTIDLKREKVTTLLDYTGRHQWTRFRQPPGQGPRQSGKSPSDNQR